MMAVYCSVCGKSVSTECACGVDLDWGETPVTPRVRSSKQLRGIITFARQQWRIDGAEGETVHALCDALESRLDDEQQKGTTDSPGGGP